MKINDSYDPRSYTKMQALPPVYKVHPWDHAPNHAARDGSDGTPGDEKPEGHDLVVESDEEEAVTEVSYKNWSISSVLCWILCSVSRRNEVLVVCQGGKVWVKKIDYVCTFNQRLIKL